MAAKKLVRDLVLSGHPLRLHLSSQAQVFFLLELFLDFSLYISCNSQVNFWAFIPFSLYYVILLMWGLLIELLYRLWVRGWGWLQQVGTRVIVDIACLMSSLRKLKAKQAGMPIFSTFTPLFLSFLLSFFGSRDANNENVRNAYRKDTNDADH